MRCGAVGSLSQHRPSPAAERGSPASEDRQTPSRTRIQLELDGFAASAVEQQAADLGVRVEDIVGFSVLYYLADLDSGRIAREVTTSPYLDTRVESPAMTSHASESQRHACEGRLSATRLIARTSLF
jgi:hypothetical protein